MAGTPVWLASLSRRSAFSPKPLATSIWTNRTLDDSSALLNRLIGPAGNKRRQRLFRMNVTLCLHRACTPEEVASLPAYFHQDPATELAGGPVEILWETEEGSDSTKPCHAPGRLDFGYRDPLLWLPQDCGACPPCQARVELDGAVAAR